MAKSNYLMRFENRDVKITVEEIAPFKFIATNWDKNMELENDRNVYEFETFGGAAAEAFGLLAVHADNLLGKLRNAGG